MAERIMQRLARAIPVPRSRPPAARSFGAGAAVALLAAAAAALAVPPPHVAAQSASPPVAARSTTPPGEAAVLIVRTNDPASTVFDGEVALGRSTDGPFTIEPGARTVRVVPGRPGTWGRVPLTFDVTPTAGDTLRIAAEFPTIYRLEASPGARVSLVGADGSRPLGRTPLFFESAGRAEGVFRFEAEGYEPTEILPGSSLWNRHFAALTRGKAAAGGPIRIDLREAKRRRRWVDYVAIGTAVAAGAVAVHYKMKADRRFDVYRETGDPALRPDIRKYDTYSGFAVGAMQVGVTVFAVRLIGR